MRRMDRAFLWRFPVKRQRTRKSNERLTIRLERTDIRF